MNEILEQDDLESLEELRKILLKEQETPSFVGVFLSEPNSKDYPINSTYKREGVVYINTNSGWVKFIEDGIKGKDGIDGKTTIPGGGTMTGNELTQEGREDEKEVMSDIKSETEPPIFMVG